MKLDSLKTNLPPQLNPLHSTESDALRRIPKGFVGRF